MLSALDQAQAAEAVGANNLAAAARAAAARATAAANDVDAKVDAMEEAAADADNAADKAIYTRREMRPAVGPQVKCTKHVRTS